MDRLRLMLATSGGLGLAPVAPGTFGTLGGVLIAWALSFTGAGFPLWTAAVVVVLYVVGRPLVTWSERRAGHGDPGWYVLDEVIGYLICVAWIAPPTLLSLVCAFLLFRFFDILKPTPIRQIERLHGADGVLLDDVVAGLFGLACMAVLRLLVLDPSYWELAASPVGGL
jgi:phosphatidylglycerophosphatase A